MHGLHHLHYRLKDILAELINAQYEDDESAESVVAGENYICREEEKKLNICPWNREFCASMVSTTCGRPKSMDCMFQVG